MENRGARCFPSHTLFHYISTSLGRSYGYLCVLVEDTETQRGCVTCPRTHSKVASRAVIFILPDSQVYAEVAMPVRQRAWYLNLWKFQKIADC